MMNLIKNSIFTNINFIIDNCKTNFMCIKLKNLYDYFYKIFILNKCTNNFFMKNYLPLLCFNGIIVFIINYMLKTINNIFKYEHKYLIIFNFKFIFYLIFIYEYLNSFNNNVLRYIKFKQQKSVITKINLFIKKIFTKMKHTINTLKKNLGFSKIKIMYEVFYTTQILNKSTNIFYLTNYSLLLSLNIVMAVTVNYLLIKIIKNSKYKIKPLMIIIFRFIFYTISFINIYYSLIIIYRLKKDLNKYYIF